MAKIVVAVKAEILPLVEAALTGYEVIVLDSLDQGERWLSESNHADLFVIGILFDDSKAMDLIKLIRLDPKHKETPILVIRLLHSQHEEMLKQVLNMMIALETVCDYFEGDYTEPGTATKLKELVTDCLTSDRRAKPLQKEKKHVEMRSKGGSIVNSPELPS